MFFLLFISKENEVSFEQETGTETTDTDIDDCTIKEIKKKDNKTHQTKQISKRNYVPYTRTLDLFNFTDLNRLKRKKKMEETAESIINKNSVFNGQQT